RKRSKTSTRPTRTSGRGRSSPSAIAISTRRNLSRTPTEPEPTPTTFAPGGCIRLGGGRFPLPPANSAPTRRRSRPFSPTPGFSPPPSKVAHTRYKEKQTTGYGGLQKKGTPPVPLVIAVNGLDSRKEDLTESFGAIHPSGVGFLAVDGPGTGQAPIKVSETS